MKRYVVCSLAELKPGERRIFDCDGKSVGVFNVAGSFYALRNMCPHQFAPLCAGKITGYCEPSPVGEFHWSREGEIIRCPWHAWEFDLKTGRSIFNPHQVRAKKYEVKVEPEEGSDEAVSVETFRAAAEEDSLVIYA